MFWGLPALGAALALVQLVVSESIARDDPAPRQLRPIHLRNYEASFGLHRRAGEQFRRWTLRPSHSSSMGVLLVSNSPLHGRRTISNRSSENEQLLLANMTLYAPDGLQVGLVASRPASNFATKMRLSHHDLRIKAPPAHDNHPFNSVTDLSLC